MIDNNMRVKTIGKIESINSKSGVVADIDSIRGGRLIVADKNQLSLVPVEKCKVGMVVYVQSENKEYILTKEPTGTMYTDSSDWGVKKTNAEDVYVQSGSKQIPVTEDYANKISAAIKQELDTSTNTFVAKTEFEKQMNAATTRITVVEERSINNASRLGTAEKKISDNTNNIQDLTNKVFGTANDDGLKQDINNQITAMSDKIKTNQANLTSLTEKVYNNSNSIASINTSIGTINDEVDGIKANIGSYNVSHQFQTVDSQISGLNTKLENAITKADTQHTKLESSITAVNNNLTVFKDSTNTTIDRYGNRLDIVEKATTDNKAAIKEAFNNLSNQVARDYATKDEFKTLNTTVNDPANGLSIQCTKFNAQFVKLYGDYNLNNSVSLSSIVVNVSKNAGDIAINTKAINDIKNNIDDLKNKNDAINNTLTTLGNKFDNYTLKTEYDTLNSTVTGLSNAITNTNRDFAAFQNAVAAYEKTTDANIDEIKTKLDNKLDSKTYTQFTDTINSTLGTVANNANAASKTATDALDKANEVDKKIIDLNGNLSGTINVISNDLSKLTTKVDANTNSITSINSIIGDKDIFINNANHTICDYITDLLQKDTELQNSIKANTNTISGIDEAYKTADRNLDGRITTLSTTVEKYKAALDVADSKFAENIQSIKNDITNINNTTAANSSAIKVNSDKIADLTKSVSKVEGTTSTNASAIEALQNVVKTNTTYINELKADKTAFLEDSGLSKDTATAQTLHNATLYTLKDFIKTHEISDIEKRDAKETTIIGNIVTNAKAIDAVKESIDTNSKNIDKNTKSITYLNETAKSLKLQPVIQDITSDKSTGEVKVKLDIENIKTSAFQYMTLGIAGRTKEDKTTSSTWIPNSSSDYFGIANSLLTDKEGNTNMVTVRGYITPQNTAAEDQIYLESDPMDLTKEFSISYGFIKPETKTINGNAYHQYVELGKTKIHFFDDDGVTIKIKLPDRISDDDVNADDSVKLVIGFTNVDNREADVADSCFAFSLAGAFEATSLDGATEDGGLYIIRSNKEGDSGEIVNHGSFAITSNAIRRAGEVGFVTVFQI